MDRYFGLSKRIASCSNITIQVEDNIQKIYQLLTTLFGILFGKNPYHYWTQEIPTGRDGERVQPAGRGDGSGSDARNSPF